MLIDDIFAKLASVVGQSVNVRYGGPYVNDIRCFGASNHIEFTMNFGDMNTLLNYVDVIRNTLYEMFTEDESINLVEQNDNMLSTFTVYKYDFIEAIIRINFSEWSDCISLPIQHNYVNVRPVEEFLAVAIRKLLNSEPDAPVYLLYIQCIYGAQIDYSTVYWYLSQYELHNPVDSLTEMDMESVNAKTWDVITRYDKAGINYGGKIDLWNRFNAVLFNILKVG